ncbi:MAG: peptide ABC transporter substrate-binding protein, partial [Raoultibacter sp.]
MRVKRLLLMTLSLMLVLSLVACSAPSSTTSTTSAATAENPYSGTPESDMVTIDILGEPTELNPILLQDATSTDVLRLAMAGIARFDENDKPQPDLAESWDIDNGGSVYTVHLREDARWSNGDALTAHDYVYSIVSQLTQANGSTNGPALAEYFKNGTEFYEGTVDVSQLGVKALDDYTLQIEWVRPLTYAEDLFASPYFLPVNQKVYEAAGATGYSKEASTMIYTGPYTIVEWVHDDHLLLEKNDMYKGSGTVNIPKVKLVMIPDDNTRYNAFRTGQIDVGNLYGTQIDQLKAEGSDIVKSYMDGNSWFLAFNTQTNLFSNANMRKAFTYSVDVPALLNNVIKDGSIAADGLVSPSVSGAGNTSYSEARGSLYSFDIAKAQQYLEAGLTELGLSAGDVKLQLLSSDTSFGQTQSAYLQEQWRKNLGIEVEIRTLPWAAQVEAQYTGDFDMVCTGWGITTNDPTTFLELFTSSQENNPSFYKNTEYDKVLAAADEETDPAKRQELLIKAEKILIDDMALGPMYFTSTTYMSSAKLEGLTRTTFQNFDLCDGAKIVTG